MRSKFLFASHPGRGVVTAGGADRDTCSVTRCLLTSPCFSPTRVPRRRAAAAALSSHAPCSFSSFNYDVKLSFLEIQYWGRIPPFECLYSLGKTLIVLVIPLSSVCFNFRNQHLPWPRQLSVRGPVSQLARMLSCPGQRQTLFVS